MTAETDLVTDFPDMLSGNKDLLQDDIAWVIPEEDNGPADALENFDWQSFLTGESRSPTTVDSPQWSVDSEYSDDYSSSNSNDGTSTSNKRPRSDALKLQRNKEAAARSRLKRKQEQGLKQQLMGDLENQIKVYKEENDALKLENMTLRAENATLREKIAKFAFENKASVSGVAVFGVVCLFPLFSSVDSQTGLYSTIINFLSTLVSSPSTVGMNGRVLLSDDELGGSSLLSMLGGYYGFLVVVVVGCIYMFTTHRATMSHKSAYVLPRSRTSAVTGINSSMVTKSNAALKMEELASKKGLELRVSNLRVWLSSYGGDHSLATINLPK